MRATFHRPGESPGCFHHASSSRQGDIYLLNNLLDFSCGVFHHQGYVELATSYDQG